MSFNRTVLLLTDDFTFCDEVRETLAARQSLVVAVSEPATLIEELRSARYRVLVIELDIPGFDGLQMLREIKEFNGSLQVIGLLRGADQGLALSALHCGAEECMLKEGCTESLLEAVEAAMKKLDRWQGNLHRLAEERRARRDADRDGCLEPPPITRRAGTRDLRRKYARYPSVGGDINVIIDGQQLPATILNTSFGGVGIHVFSKGPIIPNSDIEICYADSPVAGVVRWVQEIGSGHYRVGVSLEFARQLPVVHQGGDFPLECAAL